MDALEWKYSYASNGATREEVGGHAVVTLVDSAPGAYAGYRPDVTMDLRGGRSFLEVIEVPSELTDAQAYFKISDQGVAQGSFQFLYARGSLALELRVAGQWQTLTSFPYSSLDMRWWQFREEGGEVFWETSPDGVNWTTRAFLSPAFPLAVMSTDFGAGTYSSQISPGRGVFDNYNGGVVLQPWCRISTLTDDFEDAVVAPAWSGSYTGDGLTRVEADGVLTVTPSSVRTGYAAHVTGTRWDVRGQSVVVEVPVMVNTATLASAFLKLDAVTGAAFEIIEENGGLHVRRWTDNPGSTRIPIVSTVYDATAHRWWRVEERDGRTYASTSPDGVDWAPVGDVANVAPMDAMLVSLGAGTHEIESQPGRAVFDNFNRPPAE